MIFHFLGLICEWIWKENLLYILDFLCFLGTIFICNAVMTNCCFLHFIFVGACCIPKYIYSLYNHLPCRCISISQYIFCRLHSASLNIDKMQWYHLKHGTDVLKRLVEISHQKAECLRTVKCIWMDKSENRLKK